ncbi:MAG TPA: sigma-70 family RNA polymerase sigma factor [Nakamurella sp.]
MPDSAVAGGTAAGVHAGQDVILELIPVVRRVVAARVRDHQLVDDLVQETLARVMAARDRIERGTLAPYAVAVARNLVVAVGQGQDRARRTAHLLMAETADPPPDAEVLQHEETTVVGAALARLSPREREVLLAHEVEGAGTAELAARRGSTPGAIAAQLNRTRAKLRVEYLLADTGMTPPTDRCRPVMFALSAGDRRRQRDLDTAGHLLECDCCLQLSTALFDRRPPQQNDDEARVMVTMDADVVTARQQGRDLATRAGFTTTDLTLIATAISEIARNIVKFARRGEIVIQIVDDAGRRGITNVARDAGPGISDLTGAMRDGVSTYRGLGLGLPGARRLMDEFDIVSEVGKGTTVTMAKWR